MNAERELFLEFLRRRGRRVTAGRLAVFDAIFAVHGHVDAHGLWRAMRSSGAPVARATVYRNLELLAECGLVRSYPLGRRKLLWEHIHIGQQHDHLVCRGCGRVVEFVSAGIRAMQREICRAHGFTADEHNLQISGLCRDCAPATGSVGPVRRVAAAALLVLCALAGSGGARAAEAAESSAASPPAAEAEDAAGELAPPRLFDHLMITGGTGRVDTAPGAAHLLGERELAAQGRDDIHRVLRQVPGVNVQEEEGYGLRPNIGMRGSGVERSAKITLLEDGVLIAPAPYAAPAAYYFPTPARMESVEVRKGSAAVRQGPFTLGGVLNLVSTSVPTRRAARVRLTVGDDRSARLHANAGASGRRFGWLLESHQLRADGFKRLDGGGDTGVELGDYLAKVRWLGTPQQRWQQLAELKLGRTDQLARETYLGLTLDDFRRTPYRRYAASQADFLDSRHEQAHLRYLLQAGARVDLSLSAYDNEFDRNWHKLQSVGAIPIADVLSAPVRFPDELAILRGELDAPDGGLAVRNNRRSYSSRGAEAVVGISFDGRRANHRLELGLRRHRDEEDRFQEEDAWSIAGGTMTLAAAGAPGSQANRIAAADVWAVYLEDEIRAGRWSLTPGVRFEAIEYTRRDYGGADPGRAGAELRQRRNGVEVWLPGLGASYRVNDRWLVIGGLFRGFAPPGPGRDERTEAEESLNYELGLRYRDGQRRAELVLFFNDYDNLLGRDTLASGGSGSGEAYNGGAVAVGGVEASLGVELGAGDARLPLQVGYTYTRGEFRTSFVTDFADWAPAVARGDALPYLPEHQLFARLGWLRAGWSAYLDLTHQAATRTRPGRGPLVAEESTDASWVADLSVERRLERGVTLFARVRNLADQAHRVAWRPAGARPGLPRTLLAGLSWSPAG